MNEILGNRIKILLILRKKECSTSELLKKVKLPDNQISHHLESLMQLRIIEKRRVGEDVKYAILEESRDKVSNMIELYKS